MSYDIYQEGKENEKINFELFKDLTILVGTIFGLSIAFAADKHTNIRFDVGEFFLFTSLITGILILYAALKGREFSHFVIANFTLKTTLPKKVENSEDFIRDAQENIIKDFEKLIEKNK